MFIKQASIPPPTQPFQSWCNHPGTTVITTALGPEHLRNGNTTTLSIRLCYENIVTPALKTGDEKRLCLSKVNRVHSRSTTYAQGFAQAALPSSCSAWLQGEGTLSSADKRALHLQYLHTSQARNVQQK